MKELRRRFPDIGDAALLQVLAWPLELLKSTLERLSPTAVSTSGFRSIKASQLQLMELDLFCYGGFNPLRPKLLGGFANNLLCSCASIFRIEIH
jgi:hypothetical protein